MPNYWRSYAQATHKIEQRFVPLIVGVITDFRSQFISDLQSHGKDYAVSQLSLNTAHAQLYPIIRAIYKVGGLMGAKMTYSESRSLLTARDRQQITLYLRQNKKSDHWQYNPQSAIKAGNFGRNDQWVADVLNYLQTHLLKFVQNITDTMRGDIVRILQKGVDNNWSIREVVLALQDQGLIKSRAQVIARAEINRAGNAGHSIAAKSLPYEVDKKWIGAADHRERHSHVLMNNIIIDELGYYDVPVFEHNVQVGTDHMQFPGDPSAHVSNTANCFLPDELTSVNPKIIKHAFRNRYSGKVITIKTASGKKFTCTPNHPILTTDGWVKAGDLTNTHNLVKSSFINTYALSEFNVQNSPSTFKQMFDALNEEGVSMRMPRTVVNFYGDIPASDVDIVSINGELRNRIQSGSFQIPNKRFFKYPDMRKGFLFAKSPLYRIFMMETFRKASKCIIGFSNQFLSFFDWSLSHAYVHGFASISRFDSMFPESSVNNISTNTVSFSELIHTYSVSVVSNDLVNRNVFTDSSHFNSGFFEPLKYCSGADADNIGYFLNRFPSIVESDSILEIKSKVFNGHVYTFETVNQMYDINGYVARNCRCRVFYPPKRDTNGRLVMRPQGAAPIIPLARPTTYSPSQIAAELKSNIIISIGG